MKSMVSFPATNSGATHNKRNLAAFSLIELLVAVGILTIGFFSIFDLANAGLRQTHQLEQSRIALAVAQSEIENLRALEFSALITQETGSFLAPIPSLSQLHDGKGELTIRVRSPRLKEITVTVRWTAAKLGTRQVTLSTLIFKPITASTP